MTAVSLDKPARHHDDHHFDLARAARTSPHDLQAHLLDGVSRTFALTIPVLPPGLTDVVANNYLLCRIVDTIEDEPALSSEQKSLYCRRFAAVVKTGTGAREFCDDLAPLLSAQTIPAEHELVACTPQVISITAGFSAAQRQALTRCIDVMSEGMTRFQNRDQAHGLADLDELGQYCYYVAGIVGETLTRLFCEYSRDIARHEQEMMPLAVSFGQGLQMTNILKDIWDDRARQACWLPRDVFEKTGVGLQELIDGEYRDEFGHALSRLIGVAAGHLRNALRYTLMIPGHETGLRNFCLWAIGMAILTLRKLHAHPRFRSGSEVKITRRSVRATVKVCHYAAAHDGLLKAIFGLAITRLPFHSQPVGYPNVNGT
ncbi:MAG: phytoene/squalene synthase family protein [Gammaproteobacteria bacterium]